jgi:hypothetical protein
MPDQRLMSSARPIAAAHAISAVVVAEWRTKGAATLFSRETPLWLAPGQAIYVDTGWGPPPNYSAVHHMQTGTTNFGYRRIKGDLAVVAEIPETLGFPELAAFLIAANGRASPMETLGCECVFFPASEETHGLLTLGSYIDLIYSDHSNNRDATLLLETAAFLVAAAAECSTWGGSVEIGLQRRRIPGSSPPMSLLVRVTNRAINESKAQLGWGKTLRALGDGISTLRQSIG